jgi:glutathione S-transferase
MAAAGSTRVIYWGSGSVPAWRVLVTLKEKQLEFESRLLEFSKGEHKSDEVLALNPRGQVPTLKDGEVVVNESLAACIYLEETYEGSGSQLLPARTATDARALVWQRLAEAEVLAAKITAPFRLKMMAKRNDKPLDEAEFAAKIEELRVELGYWEQYLSKTQYLAGPAFTLTDAYAAPSLLSAQRYGADFVSFPHIAKYVGVVAQRPSIAETWPPHWKDTPRLTDYVGL